MHAERETESGFDIWRELADSDDLPSPPGVAARVVALSGDPNTGFAQVEEVIKLDPAISAKLLRLANSSFYSRGLKIENLHQAIAQFGLSGTLIIALTFSLIKTSNNERGLDYNRLWLRSLAAASICKRLSRMCRAGAHESFYLAGLLQDIGVLAINSVRPEIYERDIETPVQHAALAAAEQNALGVDHSEVGAWLLEHWQFPRVYVESTRTSHSIESIDNSRKMPVLSTCVAVSSYLADLWSLPNVSLPAELGSIITSQLELKDVDIQRLLEETQAELADVAGLFEVTVLPGSAASKLLAQARERLTIRSLMTEQKLASTSAKVTELEKRSGELAHKLDYDELTGVHTRAFIYELLNREFARSRTTGQPFSLIFIDLDNFKSINDLHGHASGDRVLKIAASTLNGVVGGQGAMARIGGEEFLIVLAESGFVTASGLCDKLVDSLSSRTIVLDDASELRVTASIGLSVQGEDKQYADIHQLIESADSACYDAKHGGKNRWLYAARREG